MGEVGTGAYQHGDVGVRRRPLAQMVPHHPRAVREGDHAGEIARLGACGLFGRQIELVAHHGDDGRRIGHVMVEWRERHLTERRVGVEPWAEHLVDPSQHRRSRPEVRAELQRLQVRQVVQPGEQTDVGFAEAVDRLLGVADGEEHRRVRLIHRNRECLHDVVLHGVGVLELVDAQVVDLGSHLRADVETSGEETPGEHQDVVEADAAALITGVCLGQHQRHQHVQ